MSHIPTRHSALTPYLHLEGATEFMTFAKEAFGAEVLMEHVEGDVLVHGELVIEGCALEVSEARTDWRPTRSAMHLYVRDCEVAHARALAAGVKETFPPTDQPYGERGSGVRDRWGNDWFIGTVTDMATRTG
jgi:PhnB protein